jgi:hypothetical protein
MAVKNPRRQLGQYRVMVRRTRRLLPFVALFWLVLAILLAFAFAREWHTLVKVFAGIAIGSGLIQFMKVISELQDYSRRAEDLERVEAGNPE